MRLEIVHFKPEEFLCPCCGAGRPAVTLVLMLELLRRAWGGVVRINSGFRCAKHNAEVGGVKGSRHLIGCAADVAPIALAPDTWASFRGLTERLFDLPGGELKLYPRHVHVAVPREAARFWAGEGLCFGRFV